MSDRRDQPTYDPLYSNASVYLTCQAHSIDHLKDWAQQKGDPAFSARVAAFVAEYEALRDYVRGKMAGR